MEPTHSSFGTTLLGVALLAVLGFGGYQYYTLAQTLASERVRSAAELADLSTSAQTLQEALTSERANSRALQIRLGDASNTLGTLTKLSQIDPELLQKYSKVYFLSDNYVPAHLTTIAPNFLSDTKKPLQFETNAYFFLTDLLNAAQQDGLSLKILSAYRSFGTQATLKTNYKVTYGSGANAFSADQGYSEHQLGTTVDFTTPKIAGAVDSFAETPEYAWLLAHAQEYGFELSYPKGNAYYQFEPWHWRFVGKKLAQELHDNRDNFYDLDQRTIDTYLIYLFDQ